MYGRTAAQDRPDAAPFAACQRDFRPAFGNPVGRQVATPQEIGGEADQHAGPRGAETQVPGHFFAQRSDHQRRRQRADVERDQVDAERAGAALVFGA
jgi:hypothetical protein